MTTSTLTELRSMIDELERRSEPDMNMDALQRVANILGCSREIAERLTHVDLESYAHILLREASRRRKKLGVPANVGRTWDAHPSSAQVTAVHSDGRSDGRSLPDLSRNGSR